MNLIKLPPNQTEFCLHVPDIRDFIDCTLCIQLLNLPELAINPIAAVQVL
jgi:hypothetical protein